MFIRLNWNDVLTDKLPRAALHIKGIIAELAVGVAGLEEKSVRTELGLRDVSDTLVVFVALFGVGEETVRLRTFEFSRVASWNITYFEDKENC